MKCFGRISILLLLSINLNAQQAINYEEFIDSLAREMNGQTNDSAKARLAFLISDQWTYTDTAKARTYLELGKKFSGNNGFLNALYHFYNGSYLYDLNIAEAKNSYMLATKKLEPFTTKESYHFRSRSWRNYSALLQLENNDSGMLKALVQHAIPLAQKAGDKEQEGSEHILVGQIFMNRQLFLKANEYLNKGLTLLKSDHKRIGNLLEAYFNITLNYSYMDSLNQAKKYLDEYKALLKGHEESAQMIDYYISESLFFNKQKKFTEALKTLNKGIALANNLGKQYLASSLIFQRYKANYALGKYTDAIRDLKLVIADTSFVSIENLITNYYNLSIAYEKTGDYKSALMWMSKYNSVRDSLYKNKLNENITDIEAKYQRAEKEKEILSLKSEQEIAKQKRKANTLVYLLIIAMLLSLVIITFLQLRNKKRKEQLLKNEIREMENEKKLSTYEALIDGQEKERNRLATELHDGLGGMLAAVKMNLSNTAKDVSDINAIIETSIKKLDHSIHELRLIARNLMPPALRKLGLVSALQDFCDGLKSDQLNINFQSYDIKEDTIDENTELIIYRIFQELITNAVKHSGGTEILADLVQSGDQIQITVEDNGQGFETKDDKYNGIGLDNIRSRVDFLKGDMNIESSPRFGTSITISFFLDDVNR